MTKIMAVFGTRPEAVKMAPVVKELRRHPDRLQVQVAVTAQHREMLDQVCRVFDIKPDFDLDIMQVGQTLTQVTTRALEGLDKLFSREKPDMILVQGDTVTVFAGALAAFYNKVAVGHVEAGLRTGNRYDPFPEEMMRRLAGATASLHFAPTDLARDNLLKENVAPGSVFVTGNTVIDSLLEVAAKAPGPDPSAPREVLVTAHRRENWGEPLRRICLALRDLVEQVPDLRVVYALHRNPLVREIAYEVLGSSDRVELIEPPDYAPFVARMKRSTLIITDSGGIQEEAPSLGKPVLVVRETTERPEGVTAGTLKLVGTDRERIVSEALRLLTDPEAYAQMAQARNPYGDGKASERIAQILLNHFGPTP
ncbi:MAG TPA: UDP-N-acetylglucosamine 2-epimerase (non-hydrolyzing) [Armatimonadota bacterium]|jgi:UDP-N-acetylglucosamine 2-epimerase (non-hydrolysing)